MVEAVTHITSEVVSVFDSVAELADTLRLWSGFSKS